MRFDVIVIGGGFAGMAKATELQKGGLRCAVISKGRSLYGFEPKEFEAAGGVLMMDEALKARFSEDGSVAAVITAKLGPDTALEADKFYLATGKYFAGGLVADMDRLYEPVFGVDVKYEKDRGKWFDPSFAAPQPFMDFGVEVSAAGCALKDGKEITNLFPIGEIIAK